MIKHITTGMVLGLFCLSANAALLSRAGGQAYYDDVLNITWLADANLADTNAFGVTGINANGSMTWAKANAWVAAMNTANFLGYNAWRLPKVIDTGTPGCNAANSGTDCGWNVDLSTGEMAHLFYGTLGNLAYVAPSGSYPQPGWGLTNTGPFSNIQPAIYWSGITYPLDSSTAWVFEFNYGRQITGTKSYSGFYAWAVGDGDVLAAPVPAAAWLFGGALGALGWIKRKQSNS